MRAIDAHRVENLLQMCGTYHGVIAYDTVISILHDVPTLDVRPVVHGKWLHTDDMYEVPFCSVCKWEDGDYYESKFCPNCGADLRKHNGEDQTNN